MNKLKDIVRQKLSKRFLVPAMAGAMALSLGVYEFASPVRAASPAPAPAAAPLDDSSVGALLSLDQAMEHLASHVTPAVETQAADAVAATEPERQRRSRP
jgi:hypothetical protein